MTIAAIIIGSSLLIGILWVITIAGRIGNPELDKFMKQRYAHRGLHNEERPENSLAAFKAAADKGYAIELDVHLLADGYIGVMHDYRLLRTTGRVGYIKDLTRAELKDYKLEGTDEHIPTLQEVLEVVDGRVPLLIEIKNTKTNAILCSALSWEMRNYKGEWCIESFDPRCVRWFKKHRPDVVRGQLIQNFFKDHSQLQLFFGIILTSMCTNILCQPDFIAHKFEDRNNLANLIARDFWNMKGFSWTITNEKAMKKAEKMGNAIIFEDFEP